jgi:hypothetical protein
MTWDVNATNTWQFTANGRTFGVWMNYYSDPGDYQVALLEDVNGTWTQVAIVYDAIPQAGGDWSALVSGSGGFASWIAGIILKINEALAKAFAPAPPPPSGDPTAWAEFLVWAMENLEVTVTPTGATVGLKVTP